MVRDDLFPGGTKARFIPRLFADTGELVYASPAEGGAQSAIALVAKQLGKRATIFVAKRSVPHARTRMAKALGATVYQVVPGHLTVVQARARAYAIHAGAKLAPFGLDVPEAVDAIAEAALAVGIAPDEVWCAAGSGVLARGLAKAWPSAVRHVVEVGRHLAPRDVAGAAIHSVDVAFKDPAKTQPPFPSDPHYDAKAWDICARERGAGRVVFWNVTGPAEFYPATNPASPSAVMP